MDGAELAKRFAAGRHRVRGGLPDQAITGQALWRSPSLMQINGAGRKLRQDVRLLCGHPRNQ